MRRVPGPRIRGQLVASMRARTAALVVVAGLGWGIGFAGPSAIPSPADAGPALSGPVTLNADSITVDNRGTTLVARGHVAVTYGALRVTSDALRINRPTGAATFKGRVAVTDPKGRASAQEVTLTMTGGDRVTLVVLSGRASVETPSYALLADLIAADRQHDRLEASGNVTLFSQPDLIVTGTRLSYDEGTRYAVIRGDAATRATIQNRDGRIRGRWMEVFRKTGQAIIHGPIDAEIYDATLTGSDATIDLDRGIAVVMGRVAVLRRQGTLLADRVTVYYRARRFVAEGTTHLTLRDLDESSSP